MGLLDALINGLLGAFGIVKREKPFEPTDPVVFKQTLQLKLEEAAAAGKLFLFVGCVGMRDPNFVSGGIQGAQDDGGSFFSHVFTGVGETAGNAMRAKYPFLLKNPKIPPQAQPWEIIESVDAGVVCNPLEYYLNDKFQMHLYGRAFTTPEAEAILLRAYATVGDAYDYAEIAKHVFGIIPDSDRLMVCSSAACYYFEIVTRLVKASIKPGTETPKDVNAYLFADNQWDFYTFNIRVVQPVS